MNLRTGAVVLLAVAGLTACSSSTSGSVQPPKNTPNTATNSPTSQAVDTGSAAPTDTVNSAGPTGAVGGASAYCAKLNGLSSQLGGLNSNPSDPTQAFDKAITYLNGLKDGAPADVSAALGDMVTLLQGAKQAYADPTHVDPTALANLGTKLSTDSQVIAGYIAKNCAGG
ncbi:MAG: hypothetical protein ABI232_09010 [Jatrophihabitantaceae bacterium]